MAIVEATSNVPAISGEIDYSKIGMEDYDPKSDGVTARLRIQKTGTFLDTLTNEEFETLEDVIVLGHVKGRTLFHYDIGKQELLCRSNDAVTGKPNDGFPWDLTPGIAKTDEGLACETCPLAQWGTHPRRDGSYCDLQYTLPILIPLEAGGYKPTLLTVKRTGLAPTRKLIGAFQSEGAPMFAYYTTISLDVNRKSDNEYAVPAYKRSAQTDTAEWPFFAQRYLDLRAFLHRTGNGAQSSEPEVVAAPRKVAAVAEHKAKQDAVDAQVVNNFDEEPF